MKVVINTCYGGFSVSKAVYDYLGIPWDNYGYINLERNDPTLIAAIEAVGLEAAAGRYAQLKIVDIPEDIEWYIDEYDGMESIHENHKVWD